MIVEHNHYGLRKDFDEDTAIHTLYAYSAGMAMQLLGHQSAKY